MRIHYLNPNNGDVVTLKHLTPESEGIFEWLNHMIAQDPDANFFFTVDSTDIWEYV